MTKIQIFIVDDHPVVRRGLKSLLSNYDDLIVLEDADTLASAREGITKHNPDVVLLDIRLQNESGLDLLDWIKVEHPQIKVIVLTSFGDDEYVLRALNSGASGYILKSGSDELLCDAVRVVYRNGNVLSSQVTEQLVQAFSERDASSLRKNSEFNEEELKILRLLVDGASNDMIAAELYMSVASIKRRLQKIFYKLSVANRSLAIAETVRRELLS